MNNNNSSGEWAKSLGNIIFWIGILIASCSLIFIILIWVSAAIDPPTDTFGVGLAFLGGSFFVVMGLILTVTGWILKSSIYLFYKKEFKSYPLIIGVLISIPILIGLFSRLEDIRFYEDYVMSPILRQATSLSIIVFIINILALDILLIKFAVFKNHQSLRGLGILTLSLVCLIVYSFFLRLPRLTEELLELGYFPISLKIKALFFTIIPLSGVIISFIPKSLGVKKSILLNILVGFILIMTIGLLFVGISLDHSTLNSIQTTVKLPTLSAVGYSIDKYQNLIKTKFKKNLISKTKYKIAFVKTDLSKKTSTLFVMNDDGSELKQVINFECICCDSSKWGCIHRISNPKLNPKQNKIAFALTLPHPKNPENDYITDICIVNVDGTGFKNLTNDRYWQDYPYWSNDGKKIFFRERRSGYYKNAVINIDGSGRQLLSDVRTFAEWRESGEKLPSSPNGRFNGKWFRALYYDIIRIYDSVTKKYIKLLVYPPDVLPSESWFDWAPDSKKFVFIHHDEVWVGDIKGNIRCLTNFFYENGPYEYEICYVGY